METSQEGRVGGTREVWIIRQTNSNIHDFTCPDGMKGPAGCPKLPPHGRICLVLAAEVHTFTRIRNQSHRVHLR